MAVVGYEILATPEYQPQIIQEIPTEGHPDWLCVRDSAVYVGVAAAVVVGELLNITDTCTFTYSFAIFIFCHKYMYYTFV